VQRRFWWVGGLIAATLLTALFWGALVHGETFAHRDLGHYYRAAKAIIPGLARASGGLPQWNPLYASGQPLAANPEHELYHPMTALLFLLPFEWAFRLQVMLPPVLAAAAMFGLLRALRRSQPAALFGAICWGAGGYLLSTSNLLPILFAVAALPLALLFVVRAGRSGRPADIAGVALGFGLVCLAGEPSTMLATPALALAALLADRRRGPRGTGAVALGLILGAALGGVTLVPGIHHAGKTRRAAGLDPAVASQWSMPPVRLGELVAPNLLGHVDDRDASRYWGRRLYPGREFPFLYSFYPGLLATLLAAAALARRRSLWPWLAVAAVGVLMAMGDHTPLWPLARRLPLLSGMRFPEKLSLLLALPLVVLAAHGFDQVVLGPRRARRSIVVALLALALAGLATGGVLKVVATGTAAVALRMTAVALAAALTLIAGARLGRRAGALLVCALLAVDLASAGRELVPTVPVARVAAPPAALAPLIASGRDEVLFHLAAWDPRLGQRPGLAAPPVPAQWGLALALEQDFDLTQLDWTLRSSELFWRAVEEAPALMGPLLRRRGVTAIVRFRQGAAAERGRTPPLELLATGDTQPFAFAARKAELVRGDAGWLAAVARLGDELATTALVDESNRVGLPSPDPGPADVTVLHRTPMTAALGIAAHGPAPSLVALNQTWDESWRALLDGQPVQLLRVDVALSGVLVPPGSHQLMLDYRDHWIDAGLLVTAAGALGCLALIVAGRRRSSS
jgi:hypothetical protein